ncbi:MAG TPA: hypothetical protein V6D19_17825 [Stenomitos sp.]
MATARARTGQEQEPTALLHDDPEFENRPEVPDFSRCDPAALQKPTCRSYSSVAMMYQSTRTEYWWNRRDPIPTRWFLVALR